jgi:hypothetical protein
MGSRLGGFLGGMCILGVTIYRNSLYFPVGAHSSVG